MPDMSNVSAAGSIILDLNYFLFLINVFNHDQMAPPVTSNSMGPICPLAF